jgi:hypothetical protein
MTASDKTQPDQTGQDKLNSEKQMILLGIGHRARQGKDTAAEAIVNYYGAKNEVHLKHGTTEGIVRVQRVGFADALYEMARNQYGMEGKDAPLLQKLGMMMREEDPDYWIKKAFDRISPSTDIVVISDVRYTNEAMYIRERGGYLLKVTRLTETGHEYVDPSRPADHPSETDLNNYDFDFYFRISEGHAALTGELAITLAEYLKGLGPRK